MSWPWASHAIVLIVLFLTVSAQQQPQESNSSVIVSSTGDGHTRQSSISGQAVRSDIIDSGGLLSSVNNEQLVLVKAASGFAGSIEALAAHLHADDDLVSGSLTQPVALLMSYIRTLLLSKLSRLSSIHSAAGCSKRTGWQLIKCFYENVLICQQCIVLLAAQHAVSFLPLFYTRGP